MKNEWPKNRPIRLKNKNCPYCGLAFDRSSVIANEDHVVGKNFVPKGSLAASWNLIVNSCNEFTGNRCNLVKSTLEAEISSITMQPDVLGAHPHDDPRVASEARRKADQRSSRTGKSVRASNENMKFDVQVVPGLTMSFDMHAAPQLNEEKVFELACFHLRALYYLSTYDKQSRRGTLCPDIFPCLQLRKADWGNSTMMAFMRDTKHWKPVLLRYGTNVFFQAVLRRAPGNKFWSWAVEWNHSVRVVGLLGDEAAMTEWAEKALPKRVVEPLEVSVGNRKGKVFAVTETALAKADDVLFMP